MDENLILSSTVLNNKERYIQMLCLFSKQFSRFVEEFLEYGTHVHRLSSYRTFGETSVTDFLMYGLLKTIESSHLADKFIIEYPNEQTTGADMEWVFVNIKTRKKLTILLQAKKIYLNDKININWRKSNYKQLTHLAAESMQNVRGDKLQSQVLCEAAQTVNAVPLYIFYNDKLTCNDVRADNNNISGSEIASGYDINNLLLHHHNPRRYNVKTLEVIQSYTHPLTILFCHDDCSRAITTPDPNHAAPNMPYPINIDLNTTAPYGTPHTQPSFPSPKAIKERIEKYLKMEANLQNIDEKEIQEYKYRSSIQSIEFKGKYEDSTKLDRWRVTFISDIEYPT